VIRSFADKRTAALFVGYQIRALPNQIQNRARARLYAIDAAKQLDDLRIPPGKPSGSLTRRSPRAIQHPHQ
jgi:proteic killer suppression protein